MHNFSSTQSEPESSFIINMRSMQWQDVAKSKAKQGSIRFNCKYCARSSSSLENNNAPGAQIMKFGNWVKRNKDKTKTQTAVQRLLHRSAWATRVISNHLACLPDWLTDDAIANCHYTIEIALIGEKERETIQHTWTRGRKLEHTLEQLYRACLSSNSLSSSFTFSGSCVFVLL